jgi:hypothetical protein
MGPVDKEEDVEKPQEDLDLIYTWQKENNMLFNGKKFEMLCYAKRCYGTNEDLKFDTNYYTPELDDIIEVKSNLRDLGIIISDNAMFEDHINHVKGVRDILHRFNNVFPLKVEYKNLTKCEYKEYYGKFYTIGYSSGFYSSLRDQS